MHAIHDKKLIHEKKIKEHTMTERTYTGLTATSNKDANIVPQDLISQSLDKALPSIILPLLYLLKEKMLTKTCNFDFVMRMHASNHI